MQLTLRCGTAQSGGFAFLCMPLLGYKLHEYSFISLFFQLQIPVLNKTLLPSLPEEHLV
jgi:hypothetical protein